MASVFLTNARLLNGLCDLKRVFNSCERCFQVIKRGGDSSVEQVSLVTRLISLGLTIAEIWMVIQDKKSETIRSVKNFEMSLRLFDFPVSLVSEMSGAEGSFKSLMRVMEKGILGPCSDLFRVIAQIENYRTCSFLEMAPEELREAREPVYEIDYTDGYAAAELVGYRRVHVNECRERLERSEKAEIEITWVRCLLEMGIVEWVAPPLLQGLRWFLKSLEDGAVNNVDSCDEDVDVFCGI